jgi:hypothetical protein
MVLTVFASVIKIQLGVEEVGMKSVMMRVSYKEKTREANQPYASLLVNDAEKDDTDKF